MFKIQHKNLSMAPMKQKLSPILILNKNSLRDALSSASQLYTASSYFLEHLL
jgi:hypothetical protein